ncbi:MAG: hypothetical protein ACOYU1_10465 [Bacteroidota bacterium]
MKKLIILLILTTFILSSCRSRKEMVTVPYTKTVERNTSTLVPVVIRGDSTLLQAYFECDSTNKVIMRSLEEYKSKNSTSKVSFDSGKFMYTNTKITDTIYSRIDTVYTYKEIPVTVETEKTVYRMTKIQSVLFYVGIIAITTVAVWLSLKINFKSILNGIINLFK